MNIDTRKRKKAMIGLREISGREQMVQTMMRVMSTGKQALDAVALEMGKMVAESIMLMEREVLAGPDYHPTHPHLKKWSYEGSSVYIADQKVKLKRPRLRDTGLGEVPLKSYQSLSSPGNFSEELLGKILRGLSARKYAETVTNSAQAFGVSASSVSQKIIDLTTKKLAEFRERSLGEFRSFAIFLDTIHRGGEAFLVALGLDELGKKMALGFWQGSSENHELCKELLGDLERRGLKLTNNIIFITDGGGGLIKALRDRFGNKLLHQRCAIHKSRNLQKHLAKRYRKEAHNKLFNALEQTEYGDAREMLLELEVWLRSKNESAADSLLEAFDELLTVHRLKVPVLLRKTLITTNPIESMFSLTRHCERNIKRCRGSKMLQRWLGSVLLYCEGRFHKVKGFEKIAQVVEQINIEQVNCKSVLTKKAA